MPRINENRVNPTDSVSKERYNIEIVMPTIRIVEQHPTDNGYARQYFSSKTPMVFEYDGATLEVMTAIETLLANIPKDLSDLGGKTIELLGGENPEREL